MKWRLDRGQIEVIDEPTAEMLRRKTPGERMLMVGEAWRFARTWITGAVRSLHADWSDEQVAAETRRRMSCGTDRPAPG